MSDGADEDVARDELLASLDALERDWPEVPSAKVGVLRRLLAAGGSRAIEAASRAYGELLLDVTWPAESAAADARFAPGGAHWEPLRRAVRATDTLSPEPLGPELAEALHWRRGALAYMLFASRVQGTHAVLRKQHKTFQM